MKANEPVVPAGKDKAREKKKWQINLRRYVLDKQLCPNYAPYFGLDIPQLRSWFELQFNTEMNWDNFGRSWQFEHLLPAYLFDFDNEEELQMCWNFINIRAVPISAGRKKASAPDLGSLRVYFTEVFEKTGYPVAGMIIAKIDRLLSIRVANSGSAVQFLDSIKGYAIKISSYGRYEFELLNRGVPIEQVEKDRALLQRIANS